MTFQEFFHNSFVQPILQGGFFNPVNTVILSIILIVAIYFVYRLLRRLKIEIDIRFFIAILPFIFWAATTRVLRDHTFNTALSKAVQEGIPELAFRSDPALQFPRVLSESIAYVSQFAPGVIGNFFGWIIALFPTPGSYTITFVFALIVLMIGIVLQKITKINYWKTMFVIGLLALFFNIYIFLPIQNLGAASSIIGITIGLTFIFYLLSHSHKITPKLKGFSATLSPVNLGILFAHFLDASATFFSLQFFPYIEQHVVPRFVFGYFGPISFFPLKIVVVIPVLYAIDQYSDDKNFTNFLKIAIFILGFSPGLRDLIRLMVGV